MLVVILERTFGTYAPGAGRRIGTLRSVQVIVCHKASKYDNFITTVRIQTLTVHVIVSMACNGLGCAAAWFRRARGPVCPACPIAAGIQCSTTTTRIPPRPHQKNRTSLFCFRSLRIGLTLQHPHICKNSSPVFRRVPHNAVHHLAQLRVTRNKRSNLLRLLLG